MTKGKKPFECKDSITQFAADVVKHLGDLGNIIAKRSRNGSTQTKFRIKAPKRTSLNGRHSIYNQTLVIHAREDDLSPNPSPGPKVICGQILPTPLIDGIPLPLLEDKDIKRF